MRLHQNILENLGCPNYYTHATADNVNTSNLQNYEENSTDWFEKTVQKLINTSHNRLCESCANEPKIRLAVVRGLITHFWQKNSPGFTDRTWHARVYLLRWTDVRAMVFCGLVGNTKAKF